MAEFALRRVVAVRDGLPGPEVWLVLRRPPRVWSDRSSPLLDRPLLRTHRAPFNAVGSSIRKARYHPSRFNRTLTILEPQPTHFKRNGKAHQPKKTSAVICFLSSSWFLRCSRHLTPIGKSAPFPVGRCCIPYPGCYRQAFAFSPVPYPLTYQLASRLAFLTRMSLGLPRFIPLTILEAVGAASSPGAQRP